VNALNLLGPGIDAPQVGNPRLDDVARVADERAMEVVPTTSQDSRERSAIIFRWAQAPSPREGATRRTAADGGSFARSYALGVVLGWLRE